MDINPVTGDPLPLEDKYSEPAGYDVLEGSGSVRGTTKPRRRKHAAEISCVSWIIAIFAVGVASIVLGIFLTFFATIQTVQAGVAFMAIGTFIILVATCIGRYKGNVNPNDPADSDDD